MFNTLYKKNRKNILPGGRAGVGRRGIIILTGIWPENLIDYIQQPHQSLKQLQVLYFLVLGKDSALSVCITHQLGHCSFQGSFKCVLQV